MVDRTASIPSPRFVPRIGSTGILSLLVVLDIMQPGNGLAAIRLANNQEASIPIDRPQAEGFREFAPLATKRPGQPAAPPAFDPPAGHHPAFDGDYHVIDKLSLLTRYQQSGLGRELLRASEKEGLSIALLTMKTPPGISIEAFAHELSRKWKNSEMFGMIMCLTTESANLERDLFIVPGQNAELLVGRQRVNAAIEHVKASALETQTVPEALFRASREMLSQYRLARDQARAQQKGAADGETNSSRLPDSARPRDGAGGMENERLAMPGPAAPSLRLIFALGAILGLLLVPLFLIVRQTRNRALYFPHTDIDFRLHSPYSGGNNARLDFSARKH